MKEQFLPLGLSQQLRNKGFNEPCLAKYAKWNTDEMELYPHSQEFSKGPYIEYTCNSHYENDENKITAPLYQQVLDWFWNKYEIGICFYRDHRGMWFNISYNESRKIL